MQGPHHTAQKSTSTTLPLRLESDRVMPLRENSPTSSGALLPIKAANGSSFLGSSAVPGRLPTIRKRAAASAGAAQDANHTVLLGGMRNGGEVFIHLGDGS